jgi:hypothetical protein
LNNEEEVPSRTTASPRDWSKRYELLLTSHFFPSGTPVATTGLACEGSIPIVNANGSIVGRLCQTPI